MRPKLNFLFLFLIPTFLLYGQSVDTASTRLEIDSLIELSYNLLTEDKFDEAIEVLNNAELRCKSVFGENSGIYVKVISEIGKSYEDKNDYQSAESYRLKAVDVQEQLMGKEHPDYAMSLYNLGGLYYHMGNFQKAESICLEVKGIQEKVLGKEHLDYASCLYLLTFLYIEMGDIEKAELVCIEAKTIREKLLGKEHPSYASSLFTLGILYYQIGDYKEAETTLMEAKAIWGKTLGNEHPNYSKVLNCLAVINFRKGNFEKAELMWLEAISIREKTFGKGHPSIASVFQNLGHLYKEMGNYEKAELIWLETKSIYEKTLGKEHPYYGGILYNLGILYWEMGNYEYAELIWLETKAIYEKTLGKEHPEYASCIYSLAILNKIVGDYEKAEQMHLEAKSIREKVLGKEHFEYANSLVGLALVYEKMGDYEKAELNHLEAISINEKVLGKEHPDYAFQLQNLAYLYSYTGQYEKVKPMFLEVKAIYEKTLGKDHPNYAKILNGLGTLYWKMGEIEKAERMYLEADEIEKSLLIKASHHLSESELLGYIEKYIDNQNQFLSFAQTQNIFSTNAYDNTLFHKGFLLNATQQINRLAKTDSISTEMFLELKGYNRRLADEYAIPVTERDSIGIVELEEKANTFEKELARSVAGFGEAQRQVAWEEVKTQLQAGEAAIEFVHYQFYDSDPTDSTIYGALLLRPGDEQPQFISLFEEKSLDSLFQTKGERKADYVNNLYTIEERGLESVSKPQRSLYELIWQPLEKELTGVKTIYFSPSGLLHRLNLGAIPINTENSEEETLADRYSLKQLGSTRQKVIPSNTENYGQGALLYGGIQYEMDSIAITKDYFEVDEESFASREETLDFESNVEPDTSLRGGSWNYLKWTDREVTSLETILESDDIPVTTYRDYTASEESFKAIGKNDTSPRILHLATHGFFFPDPEINYVKEFDFDNEPVFKLSDNPMIRSGLILAGGNYAWKNSKPFNPTMEDGILTAYEISQVNLSNTELVVLSACETGLGDIKGNEGVYGLQRAFKIAGVNYIIMSLWQVPDRETKDFMVTFYRHWLEDKMTIPDAFRKTQQEMKERFYNPYQWAGFVLLE